MLREIHVKNKNFRIICLILFSIVLCVGVWIFSQRFKDVREGYTNVNTITSENLSVALDSAFDEMNIIAANIVTDNYVRSYMFTHNSNDIFENLSNQNIVKLSSYINLNKYIESIYIYSGLKNTVFTTAGEIKLDVFTDPDFIPEFKPEDSNAKITARIDNRGVLLFSVCHRVSDSENMGYVTVNVNISKLISSFSDVSADRFYYIYEDSGMLYAENDKRDLYESGSMENGFKHINSGVYSIRTIKSKNYNWYYALGLKCNDYTKNLISTFANTLLIVFLMLILSVFAAYVISEKISAPVRKLAALFSGTAFETEKDKEDDVHALAENILLLINNNDKLKQELEAKIMLLNDTQIANLQAQINPHFLYNSLNIINWSVFKEAGAESESVKMICNLADLLAYTTNISDVYVSLKEEIYYTKLYANLLKQRYKNGFEIKFEIPEELGNTKTVKLCLQPLIENSVYHGFEEDCDSKEIIVRAENSGGYIALSVEDNGKGMDGETLKRLRSDMEQTGIPGEHIGLVNVSKRLKLLFGQDSDCRITSEVGNGTVVTLYFKYEQF